VNNIFLYNATTASGGAIYCFSCSPDILNSTFTGNTAASGRGGAIAGNNFQANIANSILWGNFAPSGPEIGIGTYDDPVVTFCDVKGGWTGTGNIDVDPLFVDTAAGDCHLTYPSPCRNAGDHSVANLPAKDFEGDPRIAHGTVDMGADEFHTHLYWTGDAAPGGAVEIKFVGLPGTAPVGLFLGSGVLDPPLPSMWGDWYLQFPIIGPLDFGSIPSPSGVLVFQAGIPGTPPAPYAIPMQALVGPELTNLCVLEVQ
jgi:predicted outer membrane repeat protein